MQDRGGRVKRSVRVASRLNGTMVTAGRIELVDGPNLAASVSAHTVAPARLTFHTAGAGDRSQRWTDDFEEDRDSSDGAAEGGTRVGGTSKFLVVPPR